MAAPVARMGDKTSHGGKIITGSLVTIVNGKPVARMGDFHVCPMEGHGVTYIVSGSRETMTDGRPTARVGDKTGCGATIITGSPDITA